MICTWTCRRWTPPNSCISESASLSVALLQADNRVQSHLSCSWPENFNSWTEWVTGLKEKSHRDNMAACSDWRPRSRVRRICFSNRARAQRQCNYARETWHCSSYTECAIISRSALANMVLDARYTAFCKHWNLEFLHWACNCEIPVPKVIFVWQRCPWGCFHSFSS